MTKRLQRRGRKPRNMSTARLNNLIFYANRCAKHGTMRMQKLKQKSIVMNNGVYDLINELGERFWSESIDDVKNFTQDGNVITSENGAVSIKFEPLNVIVTCKEKDFVEVGEIAVYCEDFVINTYNNLLKKVHADYDRSIMVDALNEVINLGFVIENDYASTYSVDSELMTLTDWNGTYMQINFKGILSDVDCVAIDDPRSEYSNKEELVALLKRRLKMALEDFIEQNEDSLNKAKNILQTLG